MQKETESKSKAAPRSAEKGKKPSLTARPKGLKTLSSIEKKNVGNTKTTGIDSPKKLPLSGVNYSVHTSFSSSEKFDIIEKGIPYTAIEKLSERLDTPIKSVLALFDLAQTTYNLKKRENALMGRRDTETVLYLNELIDFGVDVFNTENSKFLRWLKKPNLSLGGAAPENLLNSITGIQEVKGCLARIEYGNMA